MALLNWNRRKYTVGVIRLDSDHAAFIRGLNQLHAAMMHGKGKAITGPLLHALTADAREHFSLEETLMTSTKYPGLAHHHAEHLELEEKLEELNARHEQGEKAVCIPLLRLMRDWLSNHILEEDRKYGPWLKEHDVR